MGNLTFITDHRNGEPDILTPVKDGELTLHSESGVFLTVKAPKDGWTHDLLVKTYSKIKFVEPVDAKIADGWVGSTEV